MAETGKKELTCTVVTPERALLEATADFVALPMFDGELGVLPGRAPLVGRLGCGELRIRRNNEIERYFVDGGFAQVRNNTVTVLTERAMKPDEIQVEQAKATLAAEVKKKTTTPEEQAESLKNQERARAQIQLAEKAT